MADDRKRERVPRALKHVLYASLYIAVSYLSLRLVSLPPGNLALFGLAGGIGVIGMLHLGRSFALTLFAAAMVTHHGFFDAGATFGAGWRLLAICGISLLDAFQAALCRFFYRRNLDEAHPFGTRGGVARFSIFIVLLPAILVGWVRLMWLERLDYLDLAPTQFLYQYLKLALADSFGVLLLVPLAVALREIDGAWFRDAQRLRFVVRLALLFEIGFLAFSWHEAFLFFTMPVMLWLTVADRLQGVTTGMSLLSIGALAGTAAGYGPFYSGTHHGYVRLVAFLFCWNLPFLYTHGLMEELHAARERLSDQVAERTTALRQALADLASKHEELTGRNRELQQAESALVEAKERAEAASRAKSMHLSKMSHELRTPLNAIAGFCGLIGLKAGTREMTGEIRRYFEHIETASTRLTELIGNILDLAKIEEGRIEVVRDRVDVPALIRNIMAINQSAATLKSIRLFADIADNLGRGVVTDGDKLHKILMNLVSNALKFTPPGGEVSLRAGWVDGELLVVVTDTGVGIPEDRLERIFEAFVQADATVSQKFGGSGLGLAIARQMSQLLGGSIAVQSVPGSGTTFTVRIPAALPDETAAEKARAVAARDAEASSSAPRGLAVASPARLRGTYLLVDDEAVNRQVMSDWLEMGETLVDVAADGLSALKRLSALMAHGHRPDAILLDLHLPDMDGIEVARRIQADSSTADVPILIITADVTSDTQARCRASGVREVLTKPVDLDFLARLLLEIERDRAPRGKGSELRVVSTEE